jgi:hypothetical protein
MQLEVKDVVVSMPLNEYSLDSCTDKVSQGGLA